MFSISNSKNIKYNLFKLYLIFKKGISTLNPPVRKKLRIQKIIFWNVNNKSVKYNLVYIHFMFIKVQSMETTNYSNPSETKNKK